MDRITITDKDAEGITINGKPIAKPVEKPTTQDATQL